MRKIVLHMQTTLDNRIANVHGAFWEPFPWGDEEMAYITERFRAADTWATGRRLYEAVVPWWVPHRHPPRRAQRRSPAVRGSDH